uniref:non-specific serine/threonine protein kinase n=1 Tax=Aegilops tauschii TaxID=37682 RepID=M8BK06_AEGTA
MANKIQHTSATTREFTLELLKQITDNFSEEHVIGRGGYGVVYKGLLHDGEEIALKKLHYMPGLDDKQFMNEFNNLMRAQHPNIIRLVGYCYGLGHERFKYNGEYIFARVQERILCFEYLQGGSLDKHISDESCGLDWNTRFKIIKGVSKGINYLHNGCKDSIYHLDLKPENILLDKNLVPKIGDFGLSRLFQTEKTHITSKFMGTMGYMPPEFIDRRAITPKFDVFSFGVIIIRIVAGYEGYSKCEHMCPHEFLEHVRKIFCIMHNNPLSTKIILLRLTFHGTFGHCIPPLQIRENGFHFYFREDIRASRCSWCHAELGERRRAPLQAICLAPDGPDAATARSEKRFLSGVSETAKYEKGFLFAALASHVSETAKSDKTTFKEELVREK